MDAKLPIEETWEELWRRTVAEQLRHCAGNKTHAAKSLGISIRTLQRNLKSWTDDQRPKALMRIVRHHGQYR